MLIDQISQTPRIYDAAAASRLLERLPEGCFKVGRGASGDLQRLIEGVGGCSPYLSKLLVDEGAGLGQLLRTPLDAVMADVQARVLAAHQEPDLLVQMKILRQAKARAGLVVGLNEIAGARSTLSAAKIWSDFADAALTGALRCALKEVESKGFSPIDPLEPERDCGIAVLAMGKLGAGELNYSSDIDIIVLYDDAAPALGDNAREIAVAATRLICRFLQEQTADGYVFRTDLRLRPDPGVSAAAISWQAAEAYYEAYGQNWERAAFIRARAAAGDIPFGRRFLEGLRPFIWRKYLDFAAIEDIRSISRQIHMAKGGGEIEFLGHDLKTGRGGIREIEFQAQTLQLILGGKDESLRARGTIAALKALARAGHMTPERVATLSNAYSYLRKVEHRIQMVNDAQTHKVPASEDGAERIAAFLGDADIHEFRNELLGVMRNVHEGFADFFGREEQLSSEAGNLSFTGVEDDPATLQSLRKIGFQRPEAVSSALRHWHAGGARAARTPRARELLTILTPRLIDALAKATDPDEAFVAFEKFLTELPAGVQLFSMLAHAPDVFDRLTQIMTVAPYLGRALARRRHLIEALLENDWPPHLNADELTDALQAMLETSDSFEERLNLARRWALAERFQIAAQLVTRDIDPATAHRQFTAIADAAIRAMGPIVMEEMEKLHGAIDGQLVVMGLGRLGARTLTATSDIDLIFIYDAPQDALSTGEKPLDATGYYTRLVRRFVTALTAPTENGPLYEVDMQLRPSGGAGPAAVSKAAFSSYFAHDAWTWEVMALTKSRLVVGDKGLTDFLTAEIAAIIRRESLDMTSQSPEGGAHEGAGSQTVNAKLTSDAPKGVRYAQDDWASARRAALAQDVDDMHARLMAAKPGKGVWDIKNGKGGQTELDFIHQYLQLLKGARFDLVAARKMSSNFLTDMDLTHLLTASELFETVIQLSRAASGGVFDPVEAGAALRNRMCEACQATSLEEAESKIVSARQTVRDIYDRVVKRATS